MDPCGGCSRCLRGGSASSGCRWAMSSRPSTTASSATPRGACRASGTAARPAARLPASWRSSHTCGSFAALRSCCRASSSGVCRWTAAAWAAARWKRSSRAWTSSSSTACCARWRRPRPSEAGRAPSARSAWRSSCRRSPAPRPARTSSTAPASWTGSAAARGTAPPAGSPAGPRTCSSCRRAAPGCWGRLSEALTRRRRRVPSWPGRRSGSSRSRATARSWSSATS
mmetsp:Transcript_48788/g.150663  ORF Transcript_48788/g.150663 Transcript_48788/m.150663 type:complete len:227 (-) Transcript_48788:456-1136(-)